MTTQEMLDALEMELFGFIKSNERKVNALVDEIDEIVAQAEFADKVLNSRTFIQGNPL
jgi:hypothetical protein